MAYERLLRDPDRAVREQAARDWCSWEDAVVGAGPDTPPNPRYDDPRFRMGFARIVTHYFRHGAWLSDGALLDGARRLGGVPAVLVHGRFDVGSPPVTAWRLSRAWPGSELMLLDAGHLNTGQGMTEAVVAATDRFGP